jgi:hypothetical protein
MANLRLATDTRNAMLDAITGMLDAGTGPALIRIYSGTQPANANTALGSQVLLAELECDDPSAAAAASGVLTFGAITAESSAPATGVATWARVLDSDENAIFDCDVSNTAGSGSIKLNTTSIVMGGPVAITSLTITLPAA